MIDQRDDPTWRIASNGPQKMRWGIARFAGREWLKDKRGNHRRYASPEAAQRVIDKEGLNGPAKMFAQSPENGAPGFYVWYAGWTADIGTWRDITEYEAMFLIKKRDWFTNEKAYVSESQNGRTKIVLKSNIIELESSA